MLVRCAVFVASLTLVAETVWGQSSSWRPPAEGQLVADAASRYGEAPTNTPYQAAPQQQPAAQPAVAPGTDPAQPLAPTATPSGPQPTRAQVTGGPAKLPDEHGQVWREYDITPYTVRMTGSAQPEQAIVDWILRETGYETWHTTPVGLLSADRKSLRVYHTPQMHGVVADVVDRFVNNQAESHGFGLRIVTLKYPNWRARALPLMTPISVQSPGVQGWIMAREDAAVLLGEMRRRTDFREHNIPHQVVLNGQSLVISTMQPRSYTKGVLRTQNAWPGYQPELGQLDEGFSLEFSPLLSLDTRTTDAVVKLRLCQVEKMIPVQLEVPSPVAPNQRAQIEVPQMTMVELHERFRWPTDSVLLLSMGVVAAPGPDKPNVVTDMLPLPKTAPRADALLMVESTGPATSVQAAPGAASAPTTPATASRLERTFHGRY
ncbi:MAG: hypothetical protein KF688_13620 [Pirellulales bacterium]|nr:hypothetical protein [Pirellulales bacterium]